MTVLASKMASESEDGIEAEEDTNECPACGHSVYQAEALLAGKLKILSKKLVFI